MTSGTGESDSGNVEGPVKELSCMQFSGEEVEDSSWLKKVAYFGAYAGGSAGGSGGIFGGIGGLPGAVLLRQRYRRSGLWP